MFATLDAMGMPTFFIKALKCLYRGVWISISYRGVHRDIGYWLTRGIKQGCPVTGSLFALAVDPVLRKICLLLPRP
eukprot:7097412-Pyramimonas_sp.AAC.1